MNGSTFAKLVADIKSDDISSVESAANKICALKGKDSFNLILKTLEEDDNPLVKRVMLWTLRNYSKRLDYFEYLKYLSCDDLGVREAALVLFIEGDKPAADVLVKAAESDDSNLRYSSIQALGQFRSAHALPALITAASSDDKEIKEIAVMSLGVYDDACVTPVLVSALSNTDDIATAALSGLKGRELSLDDLKEVEKLMSSENSEIRAACVYVLDACCPTSACEDESAGVRRAFASVTPSKECLAKLCGDLDTSVKTAAADSIAKQGYSMEDALIPLLKDEVPGVRRAAAAALANSSSERTVVALTNCLSDPKPGIIAAAASSLGKIGGDEVVAALKSAMNTRNPILAGIIKNALVQAEEKAKKTLGTE